MAPSSVHGALGGSPEALAPGWSSPMKVMLLFPPNWNPAMPHLALPTLTAFLRAQGIEVIQRDLNIEVFDEVLTRRHLERALAQLRRDYGPRGGRAGQAHHPQRGVLRWAGRPHGDRDARRRATSGLAAVLPNIARSFNLS